MVYTTIRFGEDTTGSALFFDASNVSAKKVPGTLKQMVGKRLVQREVLARDILDWNISVEGTFQGTRSEIETFKNDVFSQIGGKVLYKDGVGSHTGSYLITNDGVRFDEPAETYEGDLPHITFSISLVQLNQEGFV